MWEFSAKLIVQKAISHMAKTGDEYEMQIGREQPTV